MLKRRGHAAESGAEVVLEGRVLPNVREAEGPFGENTGYYFTNLARAPSMVSYFPPTACHSRSSTGRITALKCS